MRTAALIFLMFATPAAADPGHIGEVAGHAHWIGLAAAGGAAVLAGWLAGLFGDGETEDDKAEEQEA